MMKFSPVFCLYRVILNKLLSQPTLLTVSRRRDSFSASLRKTKIVFSLALVLLMSVFSFGGGNAKARKSSLPATGITTEFLQNISAPSMPDLSAFDKYSSVDTAPPVLPNGLTNSFYSLLDRDLLPADVRNSAALADECPAGFTTLGGNAISDPSAATFKNKIFVFVRGADSALYYRSTNEKNAKWQSLGGSLISNPATYFNKTTLFVEVTGPDNQRYYRSTTDGVTFTDWVKGTVKAFTTSASTSLKGVAFNFKKGNGINPPVCFQRVRSSQNTNQTSTQQSAQKSTASRSITSPQTNMRPPDECPWWDPCEPPPQGDQYLPIGSFDGIDTNGNVMWGWSFDPDNNFLSNDVYIDIDGSGYSVTANQSRPDVNQAYGISGFHGFTFQIPAQYADGQQHTVYIIGVDLGANGPNDLTNSPRYFTKNPPPPDTPSWGTINSVSQSQLDVYWNVVTGASAYNLRMDGNLVANNIPYVSFPATGLAPGSTHSFEVQAVSQWGASGWSSPLSGTTQPPVLPATPTWGTAYAVSDTQIDIYWNAAPNATGYSLRMDGNQIANNMPYTSFPATGLAPGSTHTFEMQAVNQYGVSAWSSSRSATTFPPPTPTPPPTPNPTPTPTPPPNPTPTPTGNNTSRLRLAPKNATGGTNLYSRNFGWSTGLAGLSGRGLDAGFGISYNSLVWLKSGSDMIFNPNSDNVTPGFRFGFPVVEPVYADAVTGKNTFLMVSPSGSRIEFRQVDGTTDTFETADSSYLQIKAIDANTLIVFGTDGTQSVYTLKAGAFRCAQVKDANGNFITIDHDSATGRLQSVTDTLGRVVSVAYNAEGYPTTITQQWQNATHTYATFVYADMSLAAPFPGLNMVGITNGAAVRILQAIYFADDSSVRFNYNSFAQVWKISNYAPDGHLLSYAANNLDAMSYQAQTDCPRFTEFHNWAENFNVVSGQAQETVVPIATSENQTITLPDNSQPSTTKISVTAPDGTISNTFIANSGWMEGLPVFTEDWSGGARKRWTWTAYTQDNPALGYILNPRTVESRIGDGTNVKRTTVGYFTQPANTQVSVFGLVKDVVQYDAGLVNQLKRSHTEYSFDATYLNRRIIGLPIESTLFDETNNLMGRVTYAYDQGDFSGAGQNIGPIQHDANYNAGFIAGRGNMTSTTRWDITNPTNPALAVTSQVRYDTAGSAVARIDPANRVVSVGYADSFDDNQNRNTFAYPTVLTDPAGFSSTVKYRYDFGANVFATSPAPAGNSVGKTTSRIYDSIGRLQRETVVNTGAYTRYEYPVNGIQAKVFSTVTDVNNNGADAADEVQTESVVNGAGMVIGSRTELPGSAGGWSATRTEYDAMGRVKRQSVPTEVDINWQPSGDDATRGFLWTTNEYDWKGRATRVINTDGTDKLMSYEGCGCAGGQVTTIQSEQLPEGRRGQKIYADVLGRSYKIENLNFDGSVYSTVKTTFNGRDQSTLTRQYAGPDTSGTFQDTVMVYDGHGRLKFHHRPEQDANTATAYNYNPDDSIQSMTDARGALTTYTYNSRRLVEQISYNSPNTAAVPVTPAVNFSYDNIGNRTQMTDGLGSVTYEYNQLSQLTAETRQFNDSLPNAPQGNNSFRLEYGYSISGQMRFYKDAYGQQINYTQDKIGRLNSVTGSSAFGGVTNYAGNAQYRAWGALKHLEYGEDNSQMNLAFNNRLQAATNNFIKGSDTLISKEYSYLPTGELTFSDDTRNTGTGQFSSDHFDRLYTYDRLGRVTQSRTAAEAHGSTETPENIPYSENFTYDAFGNTTTVEGNVWGTYGRPIDLLPFVNNRAGNVNYDAEGHQVNGMQNYVYDSAGRQYSSEGDTVSNTSAFDGDGTEIKRIRKTRADDSSPWQTPKVGYFITSSALGGKIVDEVKSNGAKDRAYIYGAGTLVAKQLYSGSNEQVDWEHTDAAGQTQFYTSNNGNGAITPSAEMNALGNNVGAFKPLVFNPVPKDGLSPFDRPTAFNLVGSGGCTQDGIEEDCSTVLRLLDSGAALPSALDKYKNLPGFKYENLGLGMSRVSIPRTQRILNVNYGGDGTITVNGYTEVSVKSDTFLLSWNTKINLVPSENKIKTDNIGIGGGEGQNSNTVGISKNCIETLTNLGVWDQIKKALKTPPLIDIDSASPVQGVISAFLGLGSIGDGTIASDPAEIYFGIRSNPGETVLQYFSRLTKPTGAVTVRGEGTVEGIYYRSSQNKDIRKDKYLMVHELTHFYYPPTLNGKVDFDQELVNAFGIYKTSPDESDSDAVSRYFSSKCDKKVGEGIGTIKN